jgi:hypothetical protein
MALSPAEAVSRYLAPIQRAVSCVATTVVNVRGGYFVSAKPHSLVLGDGSDPVPLRGTQTVALHITQQYAIVPAESGDWRVTTHGYVYGLLKVDGRELIGFHWHPLITPEVAFPHLHVYEAGSDRVIHDRAHIPTGRITLEDVLRFAIRDLGVEPLRDDWDEVLTASQLAHEQHRP